MVFSTTLVFASLCLAFAAPSPAARRDVSCALRPSLDLADEPIVVSSGGTVGVPKFCGYQANSTNSDATVISPTTICFYSNAGSLFYSSTDLRPQTTELYSPCPFIPRAPADTCT